MMEKILGRIKGKEGVSEIIGTVLLLAIAVIIFSSLIVYVLSMDTSPSAPSVHMVGSMDENSFATVENRGGDSIPLEDLKVMIKKGDNQTHIFQGSALAAIFHDTNDNGRWDVGDYVTVNCTSLFGEIARWQISIAVVDQPSNAVIMSGVLQQGILHTEPPVARFTYTPWNPKTQEIISFNASESYDPDGGEIARYQWEFGDGETGSGKIVVHKYDSNGTYQINLTVTDDEGDTGYTTHAHGVPGDSGEINVTDNQLPTVDFNWEENEDIDGAINFVANVTDPDGNTANVSFEWNFGDGNTSSSANPTHVYDGSGQYTVTLIVTDEDGGINSFETTITVPNILPIAGFSPSKSNITTASPVTFDGASPYSYDKDGSIVNWSWDFGDGSPTAFGSSVEHQYGSAGNYTVTMTVTDNDGGTQTAEKNITVTEPASSSSPKFLFVDNTPEGWDSGIDQLLAACQNIMPESDYSWGKAIDQWTFVDDTQYSSADMCGKNITETVLNEFDIIVWSTGDFPGDGGDANQYPYNTDPNYWSTPMTEGGDDVSDHVYEIAEHLTGNITAGTLLMCGTYTARDLQDYWGNRANEDEIWLGNVLGLVEPTGGIHYDSDGVPFSGRLGYDEFGGEPYHVDTGTLTGIINTSSGQIDIATLNITSSLDLYDLNKQSDTEFVYSLEPSGEQTVTLLNEDMETDPNWDTWGDQNEWDWGICQGGPGYGNAHSGSRCYGTDMDGSDFRYNDNADCFLRTDYIDLRDASSATLEFYHWYEIEDGFDTVTLYVDDGNWHELTTFTGSQQSWTHYSVDVSSYVGDWVRFFWRLESDYMVRADGYYLDDVTLTASQQSIPAGQYAIDAARGENRSTILGFDLNSDSITQASRTNYLRNILAWLAEGAGYTTEVWVNNDPPEGWLDDADHVATIQEGVNAVPPGGTVNVIGSSGQIYGDVVIDRSVNLVGIDNPTITGSGTNVVQILSDWVTMTNFTVQGNSAQNGIYLEGATQCLIKNTTLTGSFSKMGISFSNAHNNSIRDNTITGALYGIYGTQSLGNKIRNNDIYGNDCGIYLIQASLATITNNIIHDNGDTGGIYLESGERSTIRDNTIIDNLGDGVQLVSSTNKNGIDNNIIQNNDNGVHLDVSNSNLVTDNTITGNTKGIFVEQYSHSNTIRDNAVSDNGYAVDLHNTSDNAVIYNTLHNNTRGMYLSSATGNVIQGNTIHNHSGEGMRCGTSSNNNVIASNTVTNNSYGIFIQSSKDNTILDNHVEANTADGIHLYASMSGFAGTNNVTGNTVTSNGANGIALRASRGNSISQNDVSFNLDHGIKLFSSSDENAVWNNTVYNNSYGVRFDRSSFNQFTDNDITNSTNNGLTIANYASQNQVYNNSIARNAKGVTIQSSTINNVTGNYLAYNTVTGISLSSAHDNILHLNIVHANAQSGIYLSGADENDVRHNTLTNNSHGIYLLSSGGSGNALVNNTIYHNSNHGIYLENSKPTTDGNNEIFDNTIYNNTDNAIQLTSSTGNVIHDNIMYNNQRGMSLSSAHENAIYTNMVHHNAYGIYLSGSNGNQIEHSNQIFSNTQDGIYLSTSKEVIIENNTLWLNHNGIVITAASDRPLIQHNTIYWHNTSDGIRINNSWLGSSYVMSNNNLTANHRGIHLINADDTYINDNTVSEHTGAALLLTASDDCRMNRNVISESTRAITMNGSSNNILQDNTISNCTRGVFICNGSTANTVMANTVQVNTTGCHVVYIYGSGCKNNKVFSNNFFNTTPLSSSLGYDEGGGNSWYNIDSEEKEGNYWQNYEERYPTASQLPSGSEWYWSDPYTLAGSSSEEDIRPLISPVTS